MMRLTFASGAGTVTGSNFLLETGGAKFLVDCGLIQGEAFSESENREAFSYDPASIDALIVTHAHLDHIGRIPKLVKDGFSGVIWSTDITQEIASPMFEDALELLDIEAREKGILPLYEKEDIAKALSLWRGIPYHEKVELKDDCSFILKDAGHILGSAIVEISRGKKTIVFTGDLGNSPAPLLRDTEAVEMADYMVMESVYGDRNHEPHEVRDQRFARIVNETVRRGGTLVIPAFSLERTQNILYSLNNLVEEKKVPSVPVFLDSPLAIKVTEIYKHHTSSFNEAVRKEIGGGDDIFDFPKLLFTPTNAESARIEKVAGPKIIIAGSGMSAGGRITRHEKNYLGDPKSAILLVGYQSLGTLGRKIEEGASKVKIDGTEISIRAHVESVRGFSSHKDSEGLVAFAAPLSGKVKKVFLAMGEPRASLFLAQRLRDYLGIDAVCPTKGDSYEIDL